MGKKYELTNETLVDDGITLHRIKAMKDFGTIKAGKLGGWIESERNLSHEGDAWVYPDARVFDNACVRGNAQVYGEAWVYDYAQISGHAYVCGHAKVSGHAHIYGDAQVCDEAQVAGKARVCEYAKVGGNAHIYGYAHICGDAQIKSNKDYIVFYDWSLSGIYFTWTRSNNMWKVGDFYGTSNELITKTYKEYEHIVKNVELVNKEPEEILKELWS